MLKLANLPTYVSLVVLAMGLTPFIGAVMPHLAHGPDCPVCERQPAVEISGDGHEESVLFVRHFGMPPRSAKKKFAKIVKAGDAALDFRSV